MYVVWTGMRYKTVPGKKPVSYHPYFPPEWGPRDEEDVEDDWDEEQENEEEEEDEE